MKSQKGLTLAGTIFFVLIIINNNKLVMITSNKELLQSNKGGIAIFTTHTS